MTSFPLVSIVIPCYNNEPFVGESIESALGQSYAPKEVIVIDDGSTDDSLGVIRSFGEQVTWRQQANQGAPAARNAGLALASGTYVKFLDADDVLVEGALEAQVTQMRAADATFGDERTSVFGDEVTINAEGNVLGTSDYRPLCPDEDPLAYIMADSPQTSLPLHRRALLEEVDGFHESLSRFQDYDLHMRLSLAGARLQYAPVDVTRVRQHQSESRITTGDHLEEDPERLLQRIQRRERLVREARGSQGEVSDRIRVHLARDAWLGGRVALRNGFPDAAGKYFAYAQSLHERAYARGASRAYRWSVRLAGPFVAERLAAWARRLR